MSKAPQSFLSEHASIHRAVTGPVVVAVMDGVGIGRGDAGDAVAAAQTPTLDAMAKRAMSVPLQAHGRAVGLADDGDMGNSEVGHNALGAGQIFEQGASRVAQAVADGSIFATDTWLRIAGRCRTDGRALHLLGLLSDGNIHSHIDHVLALVARAHADNIQTVFVHTLLDGRDTPRTSALAYIDRLEALLQSINAAPNRHYSIASGGGRMQISMDRYGADWPMVARGWACHVHGDGRLFASARQAILALRDEQPGIGDQDLPAFVVHQKTDPSHAIGPMQNGDTVIAFNFRGDRMLELTQAFEDESFSAFARGRVPHIHFVGMTQYDGDTLRPKAFLVAPPSIAGTMGEHFASIGIRQLAISETQKFGHVTYFWNGNKSGMFDAKTERYIEIPSLPAPFVRAPQMRAQEIADRACLELAQNAFSFCRLNFANGDMIGHTGDFEATKAAMVAVDRAVAKLYETVVVQLRGALIVTADHGNAEDMFERDKKTQNILRDAAGNGYAKTSHSLNPVPCYINLPASNTKFVWSNAAQQAPGLANIAATCATLLGVAPLPMWQPSLLQRA